MFDTPGRRTDWDPGLGESALTVLTPFDDHVLTEAERIIGYEFKDRNLLTVALTHASVADNRLVSNERLEFLGDAVLGLITCDYLYDKFPGLLEGELTKIKSLVVSRGTCAKVASELGLDKLLAMGKGMKSRPLSLSAAVLESVAGAIYVEAGLDRTRQFLMPLLVSHIERAALSGHQQNFKSVLQQHAQRQLDAQPEYVQLGENGPDHEKSFEIAVQIAGRRFTACWARSKKQAEQMAARTALEELGLLAIDAEGHAIYAPGIDEGVHCTNPSAPTTVLPIGGTNGTTHADAAAAHKGRHNGHSGLSEPQVDTSIAARPGSD